MQDINYQHQIFEKMMDAGYTNEQIEFYFRQNMRMGGMAQINANPTWSNGGFDPPQWTSQLVTHVVIMTVIGLVGLPLTYSYIIKDQHTTSSIIQIVNTCLIVIFGVYAGTFSDFRKSEQTFHSGVGYIMTIAMLISTILMIYNSSTYKKYYKTIFYVSLLSCLYPLQWFVGICEFLGNQNFFDESWNIAHIFIGLGFFFSSVVFVRLSLIQQDKRQLINSISMFETVALFMFSFPPTFITLYWFTESHETYMQQVSRHLTHYLIYGGCGVGSLLCIVFKICLQHTNKKQWFLLHSLTVSLVLVLMGLLLYGHEIHGEREGAVGYHTMIGIVMILCAIARGAQKYEVFVVLWGINGWLLCFSNPVIGYTWVHVWNLSIKSFFIVTITMCLIIACIFMILISLSQHHRISNENHEITDIKIPQLECINESEMTSFIQDKYDTLQV